MERFIRNITAAQIRQEEYVNNKVRNIKFKIGKKVFLKASLMNSLKHFFSERKV